MLSKAMMIQKPKILNLKKTKKTSIRVYAVKSDDNPKTELNILAYAFNSDDGKRPNTLKPGTYSGEAKASINDPTNFTRVHKNLLPQAMKDR